MVVSYCVGQIVGLGNLSSLLLPTGPNLDSVFPHASLLHLSASLSRGITPGPGNFLHVVLCSEEDGGCKKEKTRGLLGVRA